MPSHECDHLQALPALHPASDLKYLQGVEAIEPPLPLSPACVPWDGADFVGASICFTLIVDGADVGVVLINDRVSTSASKH